MEVTEIILKFAINSVSSFLWVSGLFTGKGRYGTLSLESSNLANLNPLLEDKATRTSTMGVLYPDEWRLLSFFDKVFYCHLFIMRHDVGYLCCLSWERRQCESLKTWDEREVETPTSFLVSIGKLLIAYLGMFCKA